MKFIIGTRGSALALWQAHHVASLITESCPGTHVELKVVKTKGDRLRDAPLAVIGGKGLFTKEIEDALLDKRVDIAVHSMKDLPTELPRGLTLAAVIKREDPRDAFISRDGRSLESLEPGAKIGTSSLRRRAFLLNRYPYVKVVAARGNVDTRLRKIETENLAGAVLAAAGIKRMGFADRVTRYMDAESMIPAVGQGALAVETREDDTTVRAVIANLNHKETALCVGVERAFLRRMGGGCQVPMAAHAVVNGDRLTLFAAVVHPDGNPMLRETLTVQTGDKAIGVRAADILMKRGASSIIKSVLGEDWQPGPLF